MRCAAQFHLFYLEPVALLRHPLPPLSLVFRLLETHQNAITAKETRQGPPPMERRNLLKPPAERPQSSKAFRIGVFLTRRVFMMMMMALWCRSFHYIWEKKRKCCEIRSNLSTL